MATAMRERHEIPVEHTWDLASIFENDEAWEAEIKTCEGIISRLPDYEGTLGSSSKRLLEWLKISEELELKLGRVLAYAMLGYAVNTKDTSAAAKSDRVQGLYSRAMGAAAFSYPEIQAIGKAKLDDFMRVNDELKVYAQYFDQILRHVPYTRSAEIESLLSNLGDPFSTAAAIHGTLADADLTFEPASASATDEKIEIFQGNIGKLLTNPDREVRRTAWQNYADGYLALKNTMAKCISTGVKQDVFMVRARGHDSSLEMALHSDNLPIGVFHTLIETFKVNLPTWHRYWALRKEALKLDEFHVYDIKAPLAETQPEISFEQAMEWMAKGMQPLGDEYVSIMSNGALNERWIDIYPNKGKRSGAFSAGRYGTKPFILMSYNDDIFSFSTLAHELGHSLHSYYSRANQPQVYGHYSLFVAEVASNFNQALVRDYLMREIDDPQFQISLIEEAMANFHRYFFIMPTLARFELEIHERVERGESLTADTLIDLMAQLFKEGYGDEVVFDKERIGITWAQFATHLYRMFYTYQYATGISAAHALADRVLTGGDEARGDYLAFLSAGNSVYPLDALKLAGVDMTSPAPVESAFKVLSGYVDRLSELLGVS